ncbi:VOC family protein [Pseudidiomarina mangrovi]|uniref:VOC family protein n=1 Tax=Pseudidiomarina mangrovi TaxID=2487133 RepID=UPI000FCBFA4E|nr:VOC family protein [Pseudidiomarina mangrovi]
MIPSISYITLGVEDLARSVAFYHDVFGWPTDGIIGTEFEHGAVVFFKLDKGITFALWPRTSIAHDAGIACGPRDPSGLLLAHNVGSHAEVDQIMAQLQSGGADIKKPAQPLFWGGYGGLIADPDGHLWEIVYNPHR